MAIRPTHKCFICKEIFRNEDMVNYATARAQKANWYCRDCYNKKIEQERFLEKVCEIFGSKAPGSKIWTQRKRLQQNYGYTDSVLIDCLDYIYNVKKIKKTTDTLGYINPSLVEEMKKYKRAQEAKNNLIISSINTPIEEHFVDVQENNSKKIKEKINPDDWLFDD